MKIFNRLWCFITQHKDKELISIQPLFRGNLHIYRCHTCNKIIEEHVITRNKRKK